MSLVQLNRRGDAIGDLKKMGGMQKKGTKNRQKYARNFVLVFEAMLVSHPDKKQKGDALESAGANI